MEINPFGSLDSMVNSNTAVQSGENVGDFLKYHSAAIEKNMDKLGFAGSLREVLERNNCKIDVQYEDIDTEAILKHKSAIIVANHLGSTVMDLFAQVAAMPARADAYLLANSTFRDELKRAPSAQSHILPIYQTQYSKGGNNSGNALSAGLHKGDSINRIRSNIATLREAAMLVKNGSSVMLFPDGFDETGNWNSGIVRLLETCNNDNSPYYIMADLQGSWLASQLNARPGVRHIAGYHPKVTFSRAYPVGQLLDQKAGNSKQKTLVNLQSMYTDWRNSPHLKVTSPRIQ